MSTPDQPLYLYQQNGKTLGVFTSMKRAEEHRKKDPIGVEIERIMPNNLKKSRKW